MEPSHHESKQRSAMTTSNADRSVTRRVAVAGLGAGGLGLALAARPAAAQDATPDMAAHPLVGLWQFNGALDPAQGPSPGFETYHADGTYFSWGGPDTGAAVGIWRPTGERTAEALWIATDIDPSLGSGAQPGTATFRATAEVDATGTTLTYAGGSIDVRDVHGAVLFASDEFPVPTSTRVTFDVNPATGSTVTQATPAAGTPTT